MHHLKNIFMLEGDVQVHVFAEFGKLFVQFVHVGGRIRYIAGHRHYEVLFHNPLADIDDIDVGFGHNGADAGDDAHLIDAGNGHNANLPGFILSHVIQSSAISLRDYLS